MYTFLVTFSGNSFNVNLGVVKGYYYNRYALDDKRLKTMSLLEFKF